MSKRYFKNVFPDSHEGVLNKSCEHLKSHIYNLVEMVGQNVLSSSDNDLYTGTAGIAYMFYRLSVSDVFKNDSATFLMKAIEISRLSKNNFSHRNASQFICGDAGVNAMNAAIYHQIGDQKTTETYLDLYKRGADVCKPIDFFKPGGDELFVGRAGYLYGVLWLEKVLETKILPDQDVIELCKKIVESGRKYSTRHKSIFPLMYSYYNTEYLGKLHEFNVFDYANL